MADQKHRPSAKGAPRSKRRRFSAEQKIIILVQYEACQSPGAKASLLSVEGIDHSQIASWRALRDSGKLVADPQQLYAVVTERIIRLKEELRRTKLELEERQRKYEALGIENPGGDEPTI